jgi:hypothetical protein
MGANLLVPDNDLEYWIPTHTITTERHERNHELSSHQAEAVPPKWDTLSSPACIFDSDRCVQMPIFQPFTVPSRSRFESRTLNKDVAVRGRTF